MSFIDLLGVDRQKDLRLLVEVLKDKPDGLTRTELQQVLNFSKTKILKLCPMALKLGLLRRVNFDMTVKYFHCLHATSAQLAQKQVMIDNRKARINRNNQKRALDKQLLNPSKNRIAIQLTKRPKFAKGTSKLGPNSVFDTAHLLPSHTEVDN